MDSKTIDIPYNNGGLSRYVKFQYFVDDILPVHSNGTPIGSPQTLLNELLAMFSVQIFEGLMNCEVTAGLVELRELMPDTRWYIVSGGDQAELREIFYRRNLDHHFDGGIFGSPKDKHTIVSELIKSDHFRYPALFFGDSRLDHEVAKDFGIDFVFVSQWTEFVEWKSYCEQNEVYLIETISKINFPPLLHNIN